jgi:hypothetical protein
MELIPRSQRLPVFLSNPHWVCSAPPTGRMTPWRSSLFRARGTELREGAGKSIVPPGKSIVPPDRLAEHRGGVQAGNDRLAEQPGTSRAENDRLAERPGTKRARNDRLAQHAGTNPCENDRLARALSSHRETRSPLQWSPVERSAGGRGGGARTRRTTCPCSCSRTMRDQHHDGRRHHVSLRHRRHPRSARTCPRRSQGSRAPLRRPRHRTRASIRAAETRCRRRPARRTLRRTVSISCGAVRETVAGRLRADATDGRVIRAVDAPSRR